MIQENGGAGNPVKAIHFLGILCPAARSGIVLHGVRQLNELFLEPGPGGFLVAADVVGGERGL